jgi:hypothetical protein
MTELESREADGIVRRSLFFWSASFNAGSRSMTGFDDHDGPMVLEWPQPAM